MTSSTVANNLRFVAVCFVLIAGFIFGGFWLHQSIFAISPNFWEQNIRICMASFGLFFISCVFWVAARIVPDITTNKPPKSD